MSQSQQEVLSDVERAQTYKVLAECYYPPDEALMALLAEVSQSATEFVCEIARGAGKGAAALGENTVSAGIPNLVDWIAEPHQQEWIKSNLNRLTERIDADFHKEITQAIGDGLAEGEPIDTIRKRIEAIGEEGGRFSRASAERIARTESQRAVMGGRELLWQETGVVSAKVWDAVDDACPFCQSMDGKIVALGTPFWPQGTSIDISVENAEGEETTRSLQTNFSDIDAPPLHPNCRCSMTPQIIET